MGGGKKDVEGEQTSPVKEKFDRGEIEKKM